VTTIVESETIAATMFGTMIAQLSLEIRYASQSRKPRSRTRW
jgi:hypothetical protein